MTTTERNQALRYFVTGEGDKPPYATLRYLIGTGFLTAAGTPTGKATELVQKLGKPKGSCHCPALYGEPCPLTSEQCSERASSYARETE